MSRELNFKVNNFWKLWFKYWWDKKLLSIFCILTILIVSLISVFNIFIAKEVTSLLIADTFLKNINDHNLMLKFIEHYFGNDPNYELIKAMLISKLEQGLADDFINTIIHDNYFASVFYANGELYTVFLDLRLIKLSD